MTTVDVEVLVAGAGPTGLTLACDLARRGVSVRVADKAAAPFNGSRGKGLSPRTLEVFDDLGVITEILAEGSDYPPLRVHLGPASFSWDLFARDARTAEVPYPNVWLLPQSRTEAILRARLAALGVAVEANCELRSFTQGTDCVHVTFARGGAVEIVRARYLIGADGGHSAVRKALGVDFAGSPLASPRAVVADVCADGLERNAWHVWPRGKWGVFALCPLPHTNQFQLFAQLSAAADFEPNAAALRDLSRRALGRAAPELRDPSWISVYHPQARLASRYRVGRVLLAGDAGHVHPPTGGQGLNLGVQDAYNLGWKLAAVLEGASEALLDSYQEERRPLAAATLQLSKKLLRSRWRRRGNDTKQLGVHYRDSSLSAGAARGRLRAGDRVPDAIYTGPAGEPCRLFDLLRGPQPALLTFGSASAAPSGRVRVVPVHDPTGRIRRSFGLSADGLVLVRPDGYIALIAQADASAELRAALARIGCAT